jgi:hypothetical protein
MNFERRDSLTSFLCACVFMLISMAALPVDAVQAQAQQTSASLSQHGITWKFAEERPVGQYANGDWWVLGPVTITAITPASQVQSGRVVNGTMVNPTTISGRQGYDSYTPTDISYEAALNVAPGITGKPLSLDTGSVSSSISIPSPPSGGRPLISDLAILTVVSEIPPHGAFRPHPYGLDKKSYWTEGQLNYGILQSLPIVANTPALSSLENHALRFWNEHNTDWQQRAVQPNNNQPVYGQFVAYRYADLMLSLHLNYSNEQKRDLFVGLVQKGLDIYGRVVSGDARWPANGGHAYGRKMPMLLAGLALNDANIVAMSNRDSLPERFSEDCATWYVTEGDVGRQVDSGNTYLSGDVGMPEWGIRHCWRPNMDNRAWNAPYRYNGSSIVAHALMARLTPGAVDAWNWPAFFDYADRFWELGSPDRGTNAVQPFHRAMWEAYRDHSAQAKSQPKPPVLVLE